MSTNSYIVIWAKSGKVEYRSGSNWVSIANPDYITWEQNAAPSLRVRLVGVAECELHRWKSDRGRVTKRSPLLKLASNGTGRFTRIKVHARPRQRKKGRETEAPGETKQRKLHVSKDRTSLEYKVGKGLAFRKLDIAATP